jgi:predicted O-linked N-acetylglucosamine transferase (SPINDLY family)
VPPAIAAWLIGNALAQLGRKSDAAASFEESLRLDPNDPAALEAASRFYMDVNEDSRAAELATRLCQFLPESPGAWARHWATQMRIGNLEAALAAGRTLCTLCPDDSGPFSSLAHAKLMDARETPESLRNFHESWPHQTAQLSHDNNPDPDRPLKFGIVTGEVAGGSSRFFVPPILQHHAQPAYCYNTHPEPDNASPEWRNLFTVWHDVHGESAEAIDALIRRDGIDVLIDISGHLPHRRLDVYARKPAPVQVTWSRYPCTTGLQTFDFRFTDIHADPPGETQDHYTEPLAYLEGGYLAYAPPDFAPPITPRKDGPITFGFFQSPLKMNPGVLDALAGVLQAVPESRLLLHYAIDDFDRPGRWARERLADALAERGVDNGRLIFRGTLDLPEHLALVAETDIALDAFPYSGQTTTCECLWMGVPVVTLTRDRFASRVTASILHRLGRPEWVAAEPEEYVAIAARLAEQPAKLAEIRATLREQMAGSPVCDGARVAREMEAVYQRAWRAWCASQAPRAK